LALVYADYKTVLQVTGGYWRTVLRLTALLVCAAAATSTEAPLVPLTVCEVLHDLAAQDGKNVAVLGRYSFRETGMWIGEQACNPAIDGPAQLWLLESSKDGPKPPDNFEIDGIALRKKFVEVRRRTSLGKFPFGTPDYDRWALVYGLVKRREGEEAKKAPATLFYRGSGVVIFLNPE
jgi:hypothetical protein